MIRHSRTWLSLILVALLFFTGTATATASLSSAQRTQATTSANARVQTIQFESKLIGKTLPYNVLLPVNYDQPDFKSRHYPVIYLLHGLTGHYTNWLEKTHLADYAAPYDVIIVTPEGNDGWYTDSASVPTEKYESYILQELIPDVEKRFRASNQREGRAIGGLSMGGYGALKFGVKHPEMFVFAASLSGALDAASWTEADLKGLAFVWKTLQPVYGAADSDTRAANDLNKLYRDLSAPRIAALGFIYLDCGTEDGLLQTNRAFAEILVKQKIPHEYRQLPGNHSWTYWDAQVQEVLRIAATRLRPM
ncbi:MAG: alpha/beta hydrolase [Pyrinomonadaceae bacterium]